jgi:hypothetical protein
MGDYRYARQGGAVVLIGVTALIVIADSLGLGRPVEPFVLGSLLLAAAGLLAVDLPGLRR